MPEAQRIERLIEAPFPWSQLGDFVLFGLFVVLGNRCNGYGEAQ